MAPLQTMSSTSRQWKNLTAAGSAGLLMDAERKGIKTMAEVKRLRPAKATALHSRSLRQNIQISWCSTLTLQELPKPLPSKKVCPERFIDCGIAEGNMMGVAAGLAAAGMIPFASSFAMFAAGRAFEQVRNSVGYPHLNVKIGATHAGISVGEDGATHQCCEDIALMRTIPGMVIINPADDVEARAAVRAAAAYQGTGLPALWQNGSSGVQRPTDLSL